MNDVVSLGELIFIQLFLHDLFTNAVVITSDLPQNFGGFLIDFRVRRLAGGHEGSRCKSQEATVVRYVY